MGASLDIRNAVADDLETVACIVGRAVRAMEAAGIFQWDEVYPNRSVLKDDIEKGSMRIAEYAGTIAAFVSLNEEQPQEYGFVQWRSGGRILVVHRLTVDPGLQGRKIASRLMDYAETEAAARDFDAIRLDAFTLNPAANALYANRGYRRAGEVRFRKGLFYCYEKAVKSG